MPVTIPLSKTEGPIFRQIYMGLREAVLSGAFHAGERLPATRDLADQLGVSRTVVLLAYDQLLAEGFAFGRRGSGTFVAEGVRVSARDRPEESIPLRLSRFGAAAAGVWSSLPSPR